MELFSWQLFAPPPNIARSPNYAQDLRQPHTDERAARTSAGGQRRPTVGGGRERAQVTRHVPYFVGTSSVGAEVD
eukprot:CCRYP_010158-RC/>CCRYP_010158-RC protein AED:0.48 eAED:0.48 QI:0/0/0/1/0/0/2/0/74